MKYTPENIEFYKIERQGIQWALLELKDLFGDVKTGKNKSTIGVLIDAIIEGYDLFRMYGKNCKFAYTEFNKKKEPVKAIALSPYSTYNKESVKRKELLNTLIDIIQEK